jgi:hypothetical protein
MAGLPFVSLLKKHRSTAAPFFGICGPAFLALALCTSLAFHAASA